MFGMGVPNIYPRTAVSSIIIIRFKKQVTATNSVMNCCPTTWHQ